MQNDAAEYVSKLVARLEKRLKTTPQTRLVDSLFGGVLVTQLIRGCCNNTSERKEPFVTLEVNIKEKNSVVDSLRSTVEGEVSGRHCTALIAQLEDSWVTLAMRPNTHTQTYTHTYSS